jgi:hypothetical protein
VDIKVGDIVKSKNSGDSEFIITEVDVDRSLKGWFHARCLSIKSDNKALKIGMVFKMSEQSLTVVKSNENTNGYDVISSIEPNNFEIGDVVTHTTSNSLKGAEFEIFDFVGDNVKVECITGNSKIKTGSKHSFTKHILEIVSQPTQITDDFLTSITNNGKKLLRRDELNLEISIALDINDKELFMQLTDRLKELEKTILKDE